MTAFLACLAGPGWGFGYHKPLTFEDRVQAQEAIDRVYYNHRIWPKENPGPKPPFEQMITRSQIEAKVEDYLKKSVALDKYWQRPLTGEQLQAEMNRMAKRTKDPVMLRELFAALANDPYLIAECLARPALSYHLNSTWFAFDSRLHEKTRKQAEDVLKYLSPDNFHRIAGIEYLRTDYRLSDLASPGLRTAKEGPAIQRVTQDEMARLAALAPASNQISSVMETANTFDIIHTLYRAPGALEIESLRFIKEPLDSWLAREMINDSIILESTKIEVNYLLPKIVDPSCVGAWDDGLLGDIPPGGRENQTAVWTGTEMIIWGGDLGVSSSKVNSGGRYEPSTDSWYFLSPHLPNVPTTRTWHEAVWTGTELIIWGGYDGGWLNTGGRYNPVSDSWTATSTGANVPSARGGCTAIWTGQAMIVWGGQGVSGYCNTGGIYSPATNTWGPMSVGPDLPAARASHVAVWTNSEMIIWGGYVAGSPAVTATGARYDPGSDTWTAMESTSDTPMARAGHTGIWTGTALIIWGGDNYDSHGYLTLLNSGGRYDPVTDSWTPTSIGLNVPQARDSHTAIWNGNAMMIWGGNSVLLLKTGGIYDPIADTWKAIKADVTAPTPRKNHSAIWTGMEMIIWGGDDSIGAGYADTGGRYDPIQDLWVPTASGADLPSARSGHTAIWTGTEMIIWGGGDPAGVRYDPALDAWTVTSSGATSPSPRDYNTAVWTGSEMIIWGGNGLNTGGRYSPIGDSWTATSTGSNVPQGRFRHTAVWTGSRMIVWGGQYDDGTDHYLNSGGSYDPLADTWTPTSVGSNVPSIRTLHTAVWSGSAMIIWGGYVHEQGNDAWLNTGARYFPESNIWQPTSLGANCPCPRADHTAVWTGSEMIIWGGLGQTGNPCWNYDTGGRYNPVGDAWMTVSANPNGPPWIEYHSAVWTGTEMIIWGGCRCYEGSYFYNTGGQYNPVADSWVPTSTGAHVPSPRACHTAVWTGSRMLIWGGANYMKFDGGGRYNPYAPVPSVPTGTTSAGNCSGISISWTSPPEATSFEVRRGTTCGTETVTFTDVTSPFQDTSAVPGTTYQYWVVAKNACGTSANSACGAATRPPYPTPAIAGDASNLCPATAAALSTDASMSNYQWYLGGAPINGATSSTYNASQSGNYTVSYTNSYGCTGTSAIKTVTIVPCVVQIQYDDSYSPPVTLTQLCGDGDAVVEPGEEWQVTARLRNSGNSPGTNTIASLAVNAGSAVQATVLNNPGIYGTLAANGGTATASYRFIVNSGATCINDLTFDLTNIQSTEGNYPEQTAAFSILIGSSSLQSETSTQQTTPLNATSATVNSNLNPAFTPAVAVTASLSYSPSYTQKPPGDAVLFGPDDFANATNWTSSGGLVATEGHCASSSPVPSNNYYLIYQNANIKLSNAVSTVGYTNIRVNFSGAVQTVGATLYLDWSPDGITWNNGVWSTTSTTWQCAQSVTLPSGAEGKAGFRIRFRDTGSTITQRAKVDYVKIIGTAPAAGSWTNNARVSLIDPSSTVTVLKAYGTSDANPYDVKNYYIGPGTYQIQLEENLGGTATLTAGTMTVQKTVIQCDVSSCTGTSAPPPVQATGANAARFTKNPDGNTLDVTYDAATCSASKAILLYGSIGSWSAYAGCADSDLGNSGQDGSVNAAGLDNAWFNIVWTQGSLAGHPGFGFNGTSNVARIWTVGTLCGMTGDDHSHAACP